MFVVDDEWEDAVAEAFAEKDKATDAAIAVLKWMDTLKASVVFSERGDRDLRLAFIPLCQLLHLTGDL